MRSFASDNNAGVDEKIFKAIEDANKDDYIAYGDDIHTEKATRKFKELFGKDCTPFFVMTGTAANVLGISSAVQSFNSILASEFAHINVDECGALEKFIGAKIIPIPTKNGKIEPAQLEKHLHTLGDEHHSQPRLISITQPTELGTIYTVQEIKELSEFAHKHNFFLHMDGARIANAAVALNKSFKEFTVDSGVDILSFGGTKNGMMIGEAVLFFNKDLANSFKFIRKQGMQLLSKMRYISAQFVAYLDEKVWQKNAENANKMAKILEKEAKNIGLSPIYPVESNALFVKLPKNKIEKIQKERFFYVWDPEEGVVRWMCSFKTTEQDIKDFIKKVKEILDE